MAVFLVLLATVIIVVNGRPELADEQEQVDTIKTTTHCRTTFQVFYHAEEGKLPYPECSSWCPGGKKLWIDGIIFKRMSELEEYGLMVQMTYINGSLHDCKMVPSETGEEATARQEAQNRSMDSCHSVDPVSQDETLVLSQTELIPTSQSSIPIHKRLEGFSRVGDSYYMASPEVMTRDEAAPYCERLGSSLASIGSSHEQNLLEGILATGVWTARNDILAEGNFVNEGRTPTTHSNALCEHPLEDDLNQYTCPDGYWKYKSSCYFQSEKEYPYLEGEKFCSSIGAYPVFINSHEEHDFLAVPGRASRNYIGYIDSAVDGKLSSRRFGYPFFTRWSHKEPDDYAGVEECVIMDEWHGFAWRDYPCFHVFRMLCEMTAEIAT